MSKDYHDYVIKDGKFIGKFEEMYQVCDDPWGQTQDIITSYSKMACVASLKRIKAKKVLEIGSGLGCFTDFLGKMCPEITFEGMDVSETAVNKAATVFPEIKFICADVKNIAQILKNGKYDAIIFSEIMWYILDGLNGLLNTLRECHKGKYILVNQTFYNGTQQYGKEFFTNPSEMISYMDFNCISSIAEKTYTGVGGYSSHTLLLIDEKRKD